MLHVSSADEALWQICRDLMDHGQDVSPRGRQTREVAPYSFTLTNPRARRILNSHRRWNEALAIGELCWHLSGSDSLDFMTYYARTWESFSEDGRTISGSCYGKRIFGRTGGASRWELVRDELKRDHSSRRAVLTIGETSENLTSPGRDVPCLTSLQFYIRENALNCVAYMRSNDAIWGLCYDLYLLTTLQELMAVEIGASMGQYTHIATSMHVYRHHWGLAERIATSSLPSGSDAMPPLRDPRQVPLFLRVEKDLRLKGRARAQDLSGLDSYWRQLAEPLMQLSGRRHRSQPTTEYAGAQS